MLKRQRARRLLHQKNGAVVRQVVGHGRLVGEQAYLQLDELYRALHWYVNCFQPSMKLVSKQVEGRKIHRSYDAAKTPLQRVLLSEVVSPSQQQELRALGKAFDPLCLFQQVEQLQQATLRCEAGRASASQLVLPPELLLFDLKGCAAEFALQEGSEADARSQEAQQRVSVLDWRRTSKDPFADHWELIEAWVQANPSCSSGDILRELQSRFPGRYERSHVRTLQRGLRKIRTHLLHTQEGTGLPERLQVPLLSHAACQPIRPVSEERASSSSSVRVDAPTPGETGTHASDQLQAAEEPSSRTRRKGSGSRPVAPPPSQSEASQIVRRPPTALARTAPPSPSLEKCQRLTIERAIQDYLQAHRTAQHRPKTLEWHQMALGHLQAYLQAECHLLLVHQITEEVMTNWLASLAQTPTPRGALRSASTIETYARSARALFGWLVERGLLSCSPLSERAFPRASAPLPQVVSPATFEQVMRAGFAPSTKASEPKRQAARDQALLWVLFDTGITVSEACALRVADLDLQTGLRVRGKGGKDRQVALSAVCLSHLRWYLKQMAPTTRRGLTRRKAGGDPLFGTEEKQPLTKNGVTMLFVRFRTRAGIREATITPQSLRHSFALRYLQAGGDPRGLQALMGYEGMAPIRQYLRWHTQQLHDQMQNGTEEIS